MLALNKSIPCAIPSKILWATVRVHLPIVFKSNAFSSMNPIGSAMMTLITLEIAANKLLMSSMSLLIVSIMPLIKPIAASMRPLLAGHIRSQSKAVLSLLFNALIHFLQTGNVFLCQGVYQGFLFAVDIVLKVGKFLLDFVGCFFTEFL